PAAPVGARADALNGSGRRAGSASERGAHLRQHLGGQQLDAAERVPLGEPAEPDLGEESRVTEHLVLPEDLVDDLGGAAGEQGAAGAGPGVEGVAVEPPTAGHVPGE